MIIYGSKNSNAEEQLTKNIPCPKCKSKDSLIVFAYNKYAHIYWIPLFSLGKRGLAVCNNCKHEIKPKKMSDQLKLAYQNIKSKVGIPIWHFSGLAIIAILILYSSSASGKTAKLKVEYLANPKVGDIYSYKAENNSYSTLKIKQIGSDSIHFWQNNYESETTFGISKIDKPDNYGTLEATMAKSDVKQLFDEEIIYAIDRD
jgi:hypothetical protein